MEKPAKRISPKTTLMFSSTLLNRIVILGFMVLVGFSLAKAIQSRSTMGIVLAVTSLAAGIYFLYLLWRMKRESVS
jgi:hypothetical protein